MKISLNKANKTRNLLEALEIPLVTTMIIRSDHPDPELNAKENYSLYQESVEKRYKKLEYTSALRTLIFEANFASGVYKLIAKIAEKEKELKLLADIKSSLVHTQRGSFPDDLILAQANAQRVAKVDPTRVVNVSNVVLYIFKKDESEEVDKIISNVKLEIQELQEERNALNHSTTIELPTDMVKFLREVHLVK